jgi:hypothetical protein
MEKMQQRAQQEQRERQVLHDVRAMLCPEKIRRDR